MFCPQSGGAFGDLGEDVSEQLDYLPAHRRVIRVYADRKFSHM